MEKVKFLVEVPLDDTDRWFTLCECAEPQALAAIVQSLMSNGPGKPLVVRVTKVSIFLE